MKRRIFTIIVLLIALAACVGMIQAQESETPTEEIQFHYDKTNGILTVSGNGPIPDYSNYRDQPWREYHNAKKVIIEEGITRIGKYAFAYFSSAETICLPSTIQQIGDYCFRYCYALREISIPEGVTSIGDCAFASCTRLTELPLPSTLTALGNAAFKDCRSLTSLEIPEGVEWLELHTVEGCSSLQRLHLPSTIQKIFTPFASGCTALTEISVAKENPSFVVENHVLYSTDKTQMIFCSAGRTGHLAIPKTVTYYGNSVLENAINLESVTVPDYASNLYFTGCTKLQNIYTYEDNPKYTSVDGVLFSKDATVLELFPIGRAGAYEIPQGTVIIDSRAFYGATKLEAVIMPDSVKHLLDYGFYECSSLCEIRISNQLLTVGIAAFYKCTSLDGVRLPDSVTSIGHSVFEDCKSLTEFTMPSQITNVPSSMFQYCRALEKVTLHENIESIGDSAFHSCIALTEITLPSGLTSIGMSAFSFCYGITELKLPSSLETLGSSAFYHCDGITELVLPPLLKEIPSGAFGDCSSLTQVVLPEKLESIKNTAFSYTSIEDIFIPASVTEIGSQAFNKCANLRTVHFLGNLPKLEDSTFANTNSNLTLYYIEGEEGWDTADLPIPLAPWSYSFETTASCTEGGVESFCCNVCSRVYQRNVLAYRHSYGQWDLVCAPTDEKEGLWNRSCSVCGYIWKTTIPAYTPVEQIPVLSRNRDGQSYACDYVGMDENIPTNPVFMYRIAGYPITSYLTENQDGSLSRVEKRGSLIYIETYGPDYSYQSSKAISMELPIWGGVYFGEEYNFLVYGQNNPKEQDDVEVIRIVRYTKDWLRQTHVSICGANTTLPLWFGTPRMVECDGMLYLDAGHQMYNGHQCNMIHSIRISDMTVTDGFVGFVSQKYGCIAHSMNQFIIVDGEDLLTLEHGDGYPRAIQISKFGMPAGGNCFTKNCTVPVSYTTFMEMIGGAGDNDTGVTVGGFEASSAAYLCAGTSIPQDGSVDLDAKQYNLFLSVTTKTEDLSEAETSIRWLTNYTEGDGVKVSTPHLVKINADSLVLLWTENEMLRYVFIDGEGELVSEIFTAPYPLSDCKPIIYDDALLWYVTEASQPSFFRIPLDTEKSPETVGHKITITLTRGYDLEQTQFMRLFGEAYGELPTPTRNKPAYTFDGWYYDVSCTRKVAPTDLVLNLRDHEIYARWIEAEHECNYVLQGGTPATCTEGGVEYYECTLCDDFYRSTISPTPHSWDDGTVLQEQTCETSGIIQYRCTRCPETKTTETSALGHNYGRWQKVKEPTCTEDGLEIQECSRCNSVKEKVLPAGCRFFALDDWNSHNPTCTEHGYATWTCLDCGKLNTTYLKDPLGHDYEATVTPPTCTMYGYTTYQCTRCEDSYRCNLVNALGHSYTDGICACGAMETVNSAQSVVIYHSLDLANDISINFVVQSAPLESCDSFYLELIVPVYEGNTRACTNTLIIEPVKTGDYYYFTVDGLNALQMNDIVEAVLHMSKDGMEYVSDIDRYSIATYAYSQLNKANASEKLKALCANLLQYGARAQLLKEYRTDALADGTLTEAHRAYLTDLDSVVFGKNTAVLDDLTDPIITHFGRALLLDNKVVVRFVVDISKFDGDPKTLHLRISYTDIEGNLETTQNCDSGYYSGGDQYYYFDVDSLRGAELRAVLSAAVYCGDEQVSPTLQYSVDSYGNGKTGPLLAVVQAMIAYSDSAKAFFG